MLQLKCTTKNCIHNLKCHCNAGVVVIDEKSQCDSKIRRAGGMLEQTFKEIEAAEEFLPDTPAAVECSAQCIYNNKGRCHASSVFVDDTMLSLSAKCETRIKP